MSNMVQLTGSALSLLLYLCVAGRSVCVAMPEKSADDSEPIVECNRGQYYDPVAQECTDCLTVCRLDREYCCRNCPDFCGIGEMDSDGMADENEEKSMSSKKSNLEKTTTAVSVGVISLETTSHDAFTDFRVVPTTMIILIVGTASVAALLVIIFIILAVRITNKRKIKKPQGKMNTECEKNRNLMTDPLI